MWPQSVCTESHFVCMHETAILLRICDRHEIKSCCFGTLLIHWLRESFFSVFSDAPMIHLSLIRARNFLCWWFALLTCFKTFTKLNIYFSINESVSHLSNSLFRMLLCFRSEKLIIHKLIKISWFTFDCLLQLHSRRIIFLHSAFFVFNFPSLLRCSPHRKMFRKRKFHCLATQTINCWRQ